MFILNNLVSTSIRYCLPFFLVTNTICVSKIVGQETQNHRIISYADQLAYGIDLSTHIDEFLVSNSDVGNFHLVSNNDLKLTLRFNYKFVSLSAGFAPEFLPGNDDDEQRGKSSYQNYQVNLFPGRVVQNVFFRRMKGFYLNCEIRMLKH